MLRQQTAGSAGPRLTLRRSLYRLGSGRSLVVGGAYLDPKKCAGSVYGRKTEQNPLNHLYNHHTGYTATRDFHLAETYCITVNASSAPAPTAGIPVRYNILT